MDSFRTRRILTVLLTAALFALCARITRAGGSSDDDARHRIAEAITSTSPARQRTLILSLKSDPSPEAVRLLNRWKEGAIYIYKPENAEPVAVIPDAPGDSCGLLRIADSSPVLDAAGHPLHVSSSDLEAADTSSAVRKAMKEITDLAGLADPDPARRIRAIQDSAIGQNPEKLPALLALRTRESDDKVRRTLEETIHIIELRSPDPATRTHAARSLGEAASLAAADPLKAAAAAGDRDTASAAKFALSRIDAHVSRINAAGTAFRGISLASVLLVVAIGLAITFGLMGIINMAHGEFIAVGAYTTYIVQNLFTTGLHLSPFGLFRISIPGLGAGRWFDLYFLAALPASFLAAALAGVLLERTVIRFLYRRPLESLLATWGVSLVMQQLFRMIFGPNNVQVVSPAFLSGNWTTHDIVFGWNRLFVIAFAALIVLATWLTLNRTPLGLLIRAVMQNRNMAACMGVRTDRVNLMTFAFGCGLAGLAGAFLSQIGNVGPSLGQNYIVDAFMTVVVGGVGNLFGTVISAFGIGMSDQTLQQYLGNPVIGKILVLGAIILFLQWKPAGLFAVRSRSLD